MRLEVFNSNGEQKKEPVLRLSLRQFGGKVTLLAVDADGESLPSGNLLTIKDNGNGKAEFTAQSYIHEDIPVETSSTKEIQKLVVR